jgi:hypothetical protein
MNLNEEINRIQRMMGIIKESVDDINSVLKIGSKGDEVKTLQKILGIKPQDGKFGPQTKKCVQDFQDEVNIDSDGVVGTETKNKLRDFENGDIDWDTPEFCKKLEIEDKEDTDDDVDKTIVVGKNKNIIIGDSQTPYVDNATLKANRISKDGGEKSLWEGGKTVSWLIKALKKYPVDKNVENVIICIGTNGGFGKFLNDDIGGLFTQLEMKFPKAKFLVVQGSWGWGGLKNIKKSDVTNYYKKFEKYGAKIIEPPIGDIEPHGNKPIYKEIGRNIDKML